jgi:hypothetical protein
MAAKSFARVSVTGQATVYKAFDTLGAVSTDVAVPNRAIAGFMAGAVRAAAPRRSGWLSSTIYASGDAQAVTIAVGAEYGGVVEWGWGARNIPARHYAARAIRSSEPRIIAEYARELERVTKAAGT